MLCCTLLDPRSLDKAGVERKSPVSFIDPTHRYRAIWISDIHLGTRGCKADFLLDFLKHNES